MKDDEIIKEPSDPKFIEECARDASLNQEIQMIMYEWRDRGCVYDSEMIDDVYKIIDLVRK